MGLHAQEHPYIKIGKSQLGFLHPAIFCYTTIVVFFWSACVLSLSEDHTTFRVLWSKLYTANTCIYNVHRRTT